jgi:hypothetical protein
MRHTINHSAFGIVRHGHGAHVRYLSVIEVDNSLEAIFYRLQNVVHVRALAVVNEQNLDLDAV